MPARLIRLVTLAAAGLVLAGCMVRPEPDWPAADGIAFAFYPQAQSLADLTEQADSYCAAWGGTARLRRVAPGPEPAAVYDCLPVAPVLPGD